MEHVTLNNKMECPVVGIGTFMLSPVDAENSVRECFNHIRQIKKALEIGGVSTTHSAWIKKDDENEEGAQIDLIITRSDNVANMCELKYYGDDYSVKKDYYRKVLRWQEMLREILPAKTSIQSTLITTFGLAKNEYTGAFSNVIVLDDLFTNCFLTCEKMQLRSNY